MRKPRRGPSAVTAALSALAVASCAPAARPTAPAPAVASRPDPGVTVLGAGDPSPSGSGQTVYVPVYPFVYSGDSARPFNLAATLYVRNTDRASPLVVTSVRYYDAGGRPVRDFVTPPTKLSLAPMAVTTFFVKESDVTAGPAASFLVEWSADRSVSAPVVEAVMTGLVMNQGVTLTSPGRVVDRPPEGR